MMQMLFFAALDWVKNWLIGWGGIGALISVCAWALWYVSPPFLATSRSAILHVAVTATVLTISTTYVSAHYFNLGYRTAINQIAVQNKEATDAVDKAVSKVDDCNAANGVWDSTSGTCAIPQ